MKNKIKILEMGSEGGSITLYRMTDKEKNHWFYYSVNEMAYEEFDIEAVRKDSEFSLNITEAFEKMQKRYESILSLYPLFVHPEYKIKILAFLKRYIRDTSSGIDFYQWAKVFEIEEFELKELLH